MSLTGLRSPAWLAAFICACWAGGVGCLIAGLVAGSTYLLFLGAILTPLMALPGYQFTRAAVLTPRIEADRLLYPRSLRGWTSLRLADVEGVGLRYTSLARSNGWRLKIWVHGSPNPFVVGGPFSLRTPTDTHAFQPLSGYVPELDAEHLARTGPGQAAAAIAEQVRRVQGPGGALGTLARQVNAPNTDGFETAYWSPDGQIGSLLNRR